MNIQNYTKRLLVLSFILGLGAMYGAWSVTDYVQEAEAAKDAMKLSTNQVDVAKQEVEKAKAESTRLTNEIARLKAEALANNVFLK